MQKPKLVDNATAGLQFQDSSTQAALDGTIVRAAFQNDNFENLFELVERNGYSLIDDDTEQILKAVRGPYVSTFTYNTSSIATQTVNDIVLGSDGNFYEAQNDGVSGEDPVGSVSGDWKIKADNDIPKNFSLDTGAVNAIALFDGKSIQNYKDSMMVFFEATATNTGAATLKIGTLATKALVIDNVALVAGEVVLDTPVAAYYNKANDNFELITFGDAGVIVASTAEAQAQTDDTVFISPLKLKEALQGANQSLDANGYQKLPGGLIRQWGTFVANSVSNTDDAVVFPIAFPTAILKAGAGYGNISSNQYSAQVGTLTVTGMLVRHNTGSTTISWEAIGY